MANWEKWRIAAMLLFGAGLLFSQQPVPPFRQIPKPAVVIFLLTECPISQKQTATLRALADSFPSIPFVGVFPKSEVPDSIAAFGKNYHLNFPLFSDPENRWVKKLRAITAPEAFLLSAKGRVLYRGAIDNWFFALGKNRRVPTEHFLKNAVEALLKNEPVLLKKTAPVGCRIER